MKSKTIKNSTVSLLGTILSFISLIYTFILLGPTSINSIDKIILVLTFFIIQLFAIWGILLDNSTLNYSLNIMHWIFIYIQFGLASVVQINRSVFPWLSSFTSSEMVRTNIYIIIWCIIYTMVRSYLISKYSTKLMKENQCIQNAIYPTKYAVIQVMFIISTIIFFYSFIKYGRLLFSTRDVFTNAIESSGQIFRLIFNTTFRSFILSTLCLSIWYNKMQRKYHKFMVTCLLFYCLVLYFPTNSGRLWIMVVYIGILLTIKPRLHSKTSFVLLILLGIIFVAPVVNIFRYAITSPQNALEEVINEFDIKSRLTNGDFDCYTMICQTIGYTEQNGITWGKQLISSILFFVPRSIWNGKSVGSGSLVLGSQGAVFTNVSSPPIAEGFINFGAIGVILFSIIFSFIATRIDKDACKFRDCIEFTKGENFMYNIQYIYGSLIGLFYILLRGDMLSTFSSLVGFIAPIVFMTLYEKIQKNLVRY